MEETANVFIFEALQIKKEKAASLYSSNRHLIGNHI